MVLAPSCFKHLVVIVTLGFDFHQRFAHLVAGLSVGHTHICSDSTHDLVVAVVEHFIAVLNMVHIHD